MSTSKPFPDKTRHNALRRPIVYFTRERHRTYRIHTHSTLVVVAVDVLIAGILLRSVLVCAWVMA